MSWLIFLYQLVHTSEILVKYRNKNFLCHAVMFKVGQNGRLIMMMLRVVTKLFERKIANILLPSVLTYVLGAQKNRLIEMGRGSV